MKPIALSLIALTTILFMSCSDQQDSSDDTTCIYFDERQCQKDPWPQDTDENLENKVKSYLQTQDIKVHEIKVNLEYHREVCEACYICPQGPRIYVKIDLTDNTKINELGFLNLSSDPNCETLNNIN